jgi:hypothetical protein
VGNSKFVFLIPLYFLRRWNIICLIWTLPENNYTFDFWLNKMNCELMLTYDTPALWQTGSRNLTGQKTLPTIWPNIGSLPSIVAEKNVTKSVYRNQLSRQTGSRNLTGPKSLPTIWHTYMKFVTKYQISAINSCWKKCDEKWAYMFNVYKNQQGRQTGSRNPMGSKTLPTIWGTYMKLVTKYQISAINSCWENVTKNVHICSMCIKTN